MQQLKKDLKEILNVIEKNNYIDALIDNPEVDTISGATRTSGAIKKLLINVMKDSDIYEK